IRDRTVTGVQTCALPIFAPGNPKKIASFKDMVRQGLNVVVCAPQVPCGAATQKVEQATGIKLNPVSEESSVTDVLNKVETGEARSEERRVGKGGNTRRTR